MVLQSLLELQRQGTDKVMTHLEQTEPDLAEYLMEGLSQVHQKLLDAGASHRQAQRLYYRVETLTLVCILSLRKAQQQLWEEAMGSSLKDLDPSAEQDPPAGDTPKDTSPTQ